MVETIQEINMVQELAYDNCAMFPSRQGGFNMPLGFGYGHQQSQYAQEYGQFNVTDPAPLQQAGSPCAWAGMYAGGSPAGGRAGSAGLDEWSNFCVSSQVAGNGTQSPPSAYQSYRNNAYATLPTEYNPALQMNSPMGGMSNSPSPTHGVGQGYPGVPGLPSSGTPTPRQARPPYDWMKKQQLPVTPSTGKTRTKDKYRVVYTDHQRLELEKEFHYSRYITIRRKAELAQNLNLSERQVKIWFQNRRAKERKQNKKREDGVVTGSGGNSGASTGIAGGIGTTAKTGMLAMGSPGSMAPQMSAIKTEKQLTPNGDQAHEHPFSHGHVISPHCQDSHSLTPIHHHHQHHGGPHGPLPAHSQHPSTPVQIHSQHL